MEINNSTPSAAPLSTTKAAQVSVNWQVGQILQAIVTSPPTNPVATLQIGQQQINVITSAPLLQGQSIEVEVIQIKPEPALKLRSPIAAAETNVAAALKLALPRQTSLAPLMANLTWLAQSQQTLSQLPPPMTEAVKQLISALPQRTELSSAQAVKQAIQNSGLFFENKLAQMTKGAGTTLMTGDLKAALLQLATQISRTDTTAATAQTAKDMAAAAIAGTSKIRGDSLASTLLKPNSPLPSTSPTVAAQTTALRPNIDYLPASTAHALPPLRPVRPQAQSKSLPSVATMGNLMQLMSEIGKQSEGSLARIHLQQIASTPQADQSTPQWSLELPIRNQEKIDLLQLIIDKDDASSNEDIRKAKQVWGIMLSFELENLGPMYVKLTYQHDAISTSIWAERPESAHLTQTHLTELSRRFNKAGITLGAMRCQQGKPPESAFSGTQQAVLDIRV